MAQYWLYDGTNTLELDDDAQEITLGSVKRRFNIVENGGTDGGQVKGLGTVGKRTFLVSRKEKAESGDASAFNSRRDDFQSWFFKPSYTTIYLRVRNGEDDTTYQTEVIPKMAGSENYKFLLVSDNLRQFTLEAPNGIFEDISETTLYQNTDTWATEAEVAVTNNGILETFPKVSFLSLTATTFFQVKLGEGFGFRLEGTFNSGSTIVYDISKGTLTIDGQEVDLEIYFVSGGAFRMPPGDFSLFLQATGAGQWTITYNKRTV